VVGVLVGLGDAVGLGVAVGDGVAVRDAVGLVVAVEDAGGSVAGGAAALGDGERHRAPTTTMPRPTHNARAW
ncbi:MAG: hypothetical protein J7M15_02820, partial [Anaerolineae bacterium]|nr:hypothetical protein [Anaerolineae bacterium]